MKKLSYAFVLLLLAILVFGAFAPSPPQTVNCLLMTGGELLCPSGANQILETNGSSIPGWTSAGSTSTIANGSINLNAVGTVNSGTCSSAITSSGSGITASDNILADFNADPTSTTGFTPGAMLTIVKWPSSNQANFKVCNNLGSNIAVPTGITIDWRVVR